MDAPNLNPYVVPLYNPYTPFEQLVNELGVQMTCAKCGFDHRYASTSSPDIGYDAGRDMVTVTCDRCSAEYQRLHPMDRRD